MDPLRADGVVFTQKTKALKKHSDRERSNIETEIDSSAKTSCANVNALNKVGYNLCKANGKFDACHRNLAGRTWS
jgi:hypothetical protein